MFRSKEPYKAASTSRNYARLATMVGGRSFSKSTISDDNKSTRNEQNNNTTNTRCNLNES